MVGDGTRRDGGGGDVKCEMQSLWRRRLQSDSWINIAAGWVGAGMDACSPLEQRVTVNAVSCRT
jgi:hypothetical protein